MGNLLSILRKRYIYIIYLPLLTLNHFYMPVWKMVVLCRGNVGPSVHPAVRLSFHPSDYSRLFFNTLWDINLKLGIYIQLVARHVEFEFHHNQIIWIHYQPHTILFLLMNSISVITWCIHWLMLKLALCRSYTSVSFLDVPPLHVSTADFL